MESVLIECSYGISFSPPRSSSKGPVATHWMVVIVKGFRASVDVS